MEPESTIFPTGGEHANHYRVRIRVIVFNPTFNNISVLLVEETRVPGENH
jgi:hypothetical protein